MCSSIFIKKGLICIAILSTLLFMGCHSSVNQSESITNATIQTISEISHYQSIIDAVSGTHHLLKLYASILSNKNYY